MAAYPGQRSRRSQVLAAAAVLVALAAGLASGRALFRGDAKRPTISATPCPGGEHQQMERAHAAACLLDAYLALVNQSKGARDARLADIMLPAQLDTEREAYRTLGSAPVNPPGKPVRYAKITAEYSTVVAVKAGVNTDPGAYRSPDVGYTAWVSIVDSYADGSTPLANWYFGHFAVRWHGGRWWLTDRFHADEIATPLTYTQGPQRAAFKPGWVGA